MKEVINTSNKVKQVYSSVEGTFQINPKGRVILPDDVQITDPDLHLLGDPAKK